MKSSFHQYFFLTCKTRRTTKKTVSILTPTLMCLLMVSSCFRQPVDPPKTNPPLKQEANIQATVNHLINLAQQEYPDELKDMGQANRGGRLACFLYEESGYSPGGLTDIESQELKATIPHLVVLLSHEDPKIRISATKVLRVLNSKAVPALASPALVKLLEDQNPDVKIAAADTLGCIGPDAAAIAVTPLINQLKDKNILVRKRVISALSSIRPAAKTVVVPLTQLLQDENDEIRWRANSAIEEIQRISPPSFEETIPRQNSNFSEKVEEIPDETLIKRLEEQNPVVRLEAVKSLKSIGSLGKFAVEPLIKILENKDEYWEIRLNAFAALAKIGNEAQSSIDLLVKPFLIEALQKNPQDDEQIHRGEEDNYSEYSFNLGLPPHKRHAIFIASMNGGEFPVLNKTLREILFNKDNAYKVRYSAAFILGYLESSSSQNSVSSNETISALKSVVSDSSDDFDIRWMSAFSLARIGQDMNQFFSTNYLMNPIQIHCPSYVDLFDPYTGWCENRRGGGGGSGGWAKIFQDMFGGEDNEEKKK